MPALVLLSSRCLTLLSCSGCSEATKPSGHFFLSGAIGLYGQSVFNSYGTASFVSNEARYSGGEMRDRNACDASKCPTICHSPRPNLVTYGIEQRVSFPLINVYRGSNLARKILTNSCVILFVFFLGFVVVRQRLIFWWLQEFRLPLPNNPLVRKNNTINSENALYCFFSLLL